MFAAELGEGRYIFAKIKQKRNKKRKQRIL